MIAGDISSWAEGGASMCHTVTPPAQTTISSGQDFITIYPKNPKPFFQKKEAVNHTGLVLMMLYDTRVSWLSKNYHQAHFSVGARTITVFC